MCYFLEKDAKIIEWRNGTETRHPYWKEKMLDTNFLLKRKTNSRGIRWPNVRHITMKLLQRNKE